MFHLGLTASYPTIHPTLSYKFDLYCTYKTMNYTFHQLYLNIIMVHGLYHGSRFHQSKINVHVSPLPLKFALTNLNVWPNSTYRGYLTWPKKHALL